MVQSSKPKESLESGHGLPPTVMSEDELIEVGLELTPADTVVGANQPLLQVADGSVGQGHDRFSTLAQLGPQGLNAGDMLEANFFQARKRLEPISVNGGTWSQVLEEEAVDGAGFEVGNDSHAEAPGGLSPLLDRDQYKRCPTPLELTASSKTSLSSAHPRVVNFDFAAKRFASQVDHRSAKLMEHHPGGFVTSKAKLALEEQRRHPPFVGGHQVGCPEPQGQRRLCIVKDGPRSQRGLMATGAAFPASFSGQRIAVAVRAARTNEPLRPATLKQVFLTGLFGRVFNLKLAECRRKWRTWHP